MKKNGLLTLATLILFCATDYAQKMSYGVKGGISMSNLSGGSADNPMNAGYTSQLGADGSIYGEYHVNKKFSVSVGLEYSQQGGLKSGIQAFPTPPEYLSYLPVPAPNYLYADFEKKIKLNYLLIPVLASYSWRLGKRSPVRIYAAIGPFAGFLINAHQINRGSSAIYYDGDGKVPISDVISFDSDANIKSDLYSFNAGIAGFVGVSYSFARQHAVFLEAGGNYGFMAIYKDKIYGDNKTNAAVASVGYAYTLQKYKQRGWR